MSGPVDGMDDIGMSARRMVVVGTAVVVAVLFVVMVVLRWDDAITAVSERGMVGSSWWADVVGARL